MKNEAANPSPDTRTSLTALKRQIALLERTATMSHAETAALPILTWGVDAIDRHLPDGGLRLGALHEVAGAALDLEEASLAAAITARLLGRVQHVRPGHALWIARQRDLYARALPASFCDPDRLLYLRTRRNEDTLWSLEEALRCRSLVAVIGEIGPLDLTQSRRLQLAAEKSGVPAFLIRRGRNTAQAQNWVAQPIAAHTRWRVHPVPSVGIATHQQPLPGPACWRIELWRCRGGRPGSWLVEETEHGWRETALPLPLAATLAERPLASPSVARESKLKKTG